MLDVNKTNEEVGTVAGYRIMDNKGNVNVKKNWE
jgi:hypothetical protein